MSWLKSKVGAAVNRRVQRRRQGERALWQAEDWLKATAPGKTFLDVGGMWGIHGEHSRLALRHNASAATLIDIFSTPEFQAQQSADGGAIRFIQGEADQPEVLNQAGPHELVWCWGVLYHHPNPHHFLSALRSVCTDRLILESLTAPEVPGVAQASVYLPFLPARLRNAFDTTRRGGARTQLGVSEAFDPAKGYGNNFFALTPSAVRALLATVGFEVEATLPSPSGVLRHVFIARTR